jgi:hypothetical protein
MQAQLNKAAQKDSLAVTQRKIQVCTGSSGRQQLLLQSWVWFAWRYCGHFLWVHVLFTGGQGSYNKPGFANSTQTLFSGWSGACAQQLYSCVLSLS